MGLLQKFYALISKGGPTEPPDPDEPVELITVGGASGPMTVARLREAGFDATGHETFNIATKLSSDYRILVPRREVERATVTMQRFR